MESLDFHTRQQQEALLTLIDNPRHRLLVLLMLDAGCRVSEARSRQWADCDFRKRTVDVTTLKKRQKGSIRTVPMSDRLYDAFADLLDEIKKKGTEPKGYLFPSPTDPQKPIGRSAVNNMLDRLQADNPQLGELHPHKLRHTFASNLVAQGTGLIAVRDLLGHESSKTTEIYTHADPSALRAAINAATPKPTLWQRIKQRLFPKRNRRINLLNLEGDFLVGRDKELKRIADLVSRDIHVLITGGIGIGKTHLLQSLTFDKPTLVIDDTKEFKKAMAGALLHVLGDKETVASMLYQTSDLKAIEKKVSTESLPNLIQTLIDATEPRSYLLKIGDLDGLTPTVVKALTKLKDHFTIITTARSVKLDATSVVWDFERVELEKLPRPDALKMIYRLIGDLEVSELDTVMTKVYETADGNPRMIRELSDRLRKEPFVNLDVVEEVCNGYLGRQTQEIDMSIYLLLLFGGFTLLKYWGRESGEKDLQFLGGAIMIVLLFGRYFFNSTKRKVL
ncbi:tyrosine-type recombinase/integrase [Larkinella insperata]|uniref:Tyrosine-type recombinase/integrase n=1 Tax=Larkinella insperata TaxID=332158 RepID=A0ABW3QB96_9BACT